MPNVINVFLTLFSGIILYNSDLDEDKKNRYFLIFVWIILSFVAGTRGLYALGDTEAYYSTYKGSIGFGLEEYLARIETDHLFYAINWFFSNIGLPWQGYLFLHSSFILGCFCYWIYKNSKDPLFSMIIFECLFLNVWQGSLRQALGMALLLLAYELNKSDLILKKVISVLLFVLAVLCHSTAIVCILFIVLRKVRLSSITVLLFSVFTACCYIFRDKLLGVINIFAASMNRNTYTEFWGQNPTTLILLCLVILVLMIAYINDLRFMSPEINEYYSAIFLMVAMLALGGGVVVRLAWYFGIFICLALPMIRELFAPRRLASILMIGSLLFLYLNSVDTSLWYFFWQNAK